MMRSETSHTPIQLARDIFRRKKGLVRFSEAIQAGIHRDTLTKMVESGDLQKVSRGLYQLTGTSTGPHPDLAIVAAKAPQGVVCLISALAFHELTTQIPHQVYLAIERNAEPPRLEYPSLKISYFRGKSFTEGIERHKIGPRIVRIFSREKTIADCFKFRNAIGLDTCLEALKTYRRQPKFDADGLLKFAEICRVAKVMRPYIEAIL